MRTFVSLSLLATLLISSYATTAHATASNESAEIFTPTSSLFDETGDSVVGIAPLRGRELDLFINDDLQVNQSRVFTLGIGSGLSLYPALDIGAGKGVSQSSVSPPSVRIDYGSLSLDYSSSSAGSGILALSSAGVQSQTISARNSFLEANGGDINIRSGGNIVLASSTVISSANVLSVGAVTNVSSVPEPSTHTLFFIGLALLYFSKRLQFTFLKATFHKYQRKR